MTVSSLPLLLPLYLERKLVCPLGCRESIEVCKEKRNDSTESMYCCGIPGNASLYIQPRHLGSWPRGARGGRGGGLGLWWIFFKRVGQRVLSVCFERNKNLVWTGGYVAGV